MLGSNGLPKKKGIKSTLVVLQLFQTNEFAPIDRKPQWET
jgi:hypothetical protein